MTCWLRWIRRYLNFSTQAATGRRFMLSQPTTCGSSIKIHLNRTSVQPTHQEGNTMSTSTTYGTNNPNVLDMIGKGVSDDTVFGYPKTGASDSDNNDNDTIYGW